MALHQAGIRVIMDVVYNHTFNTEGSNFERTVPGYFYRQNPDGSFANGSACGNETASEREMMRKYMVESVCGISLLLGQRIPYRRFPFRPDGHPRHHDHGGYPKCVGQN